MADATESLRLTKYTILQVTIGPSLMCDLLIFSYFIRHWRQQISLAPQNHVVLSLLVVSFLQKITDVPFLLYCLRWGVVLQETDVFCASWNWLAFSLTSISLHLVTWCCLERHLFVFHGTVMNKPKYLLIFHYIPLVILSVYCAIFYAIVIFFPQSCVNEWDYTIQLCGAPCYVYNPVIGTCDWILHYGLPMITIIIANGFLVMRVIWQKIRLGQAVQWQRQRRLIMQLVIISVLFVILMGPLVTVGVVQALWFPTFASDIEYNYFYYTVYFINQFLPFITASSLTGMHHEMKKWFDQYIRQFFTNRTQVHPIQTNNAPTCT